MTTMAYSIDDCWEEARARALSEARELARDDTKEARLYGAAAESFFHKRLEHHYSESVERIYTERIEAYSEDD